MSDLTPIADCLVDAEVFTDGDWIESKDQDPDGDVRLIQLADVGDGSWINKSARFLTSHTATQLRCTYLKPGDLLVARMPDPVGRSCIFPGDAMLCVTVVDVCIVRPNQQKIDNRYLMQMINAPHGRRSIARHITGTTRERISRRNLGKVEIPLPPLAEQKRIAAILDAADALRAKRRESLAQLDTLLQSIFLDMFGDPVRGDEHVFGDLAAPGRGTFSNGPFGSDLLTSELTDEGVPVVYIRDIRDGEYVRVSDVFVTEEKAAALDACRVLPRDVLIAKVGDPPGTAAIYPDGEPPGVITQDVIRIRPETTLVLPEFLVGYLNSQPGRHLLSGITVEATRSRFGLGPLKALPLRLAPIAVQHRFAAVVESVKQQKTRQRAHLAELDTLFASLQSRAFRGDL